MANRHVGRIEGLEGARVERCEASPTYVRGLM
jgi:hypothetical protein